MIYKQKYESLNVKWSHRHWVSEQEESLCKRSSGESNCDDEISQKRHHNKSAQALHPGTRHIILKSDCFKRILWEAIDLGYHGDGIISAVDDCSHVSALSKQESDIFFSLPMTFFCQSQCLPSFNHSILAPTDNGIKMSHAFIMSKSLNHTNVCVWLLSVLACNYNQKVWMTLALFPFCSTGSSEWLR